ncbi:hypothetical protein C1645_695944 [Glomus cerebriforme]|uniref:ATP12-domain-containing protein n=1 Tax=Glomus cerebriforme TaxID=658196 RepID=A0A397SU94_9GLOM|nr:hypothetical protein C1645_695944 [Glomus cerebriforme]
MNSIINRIASRRVTFYSTLLIQSRKFSSNQIKKKEPVPQTKSTLRRFWKHVSVQSNPDTQTYEILLDKRPLKTPEGSKLAIPHSKKHLALLIAGEWEAQNNVLKQHSLPLTSLVSIANVIDKEVNSKQEVITRLLKYLDTDAICYQESYPDSLVELQQKHWLPILDWVQKTYNIEINITTGISGIRQPENTRNKLKDIIERFDSLKLSGFERATMLSKSFLIGLALVERKLSVEEASKASSIETISQTLRWGKLEAHDVENEDIRRQLGSVACAVMF